MHKICGIWRLDSRPLSEKEAVEVGTALTHPAYTAAQDFRAPGLLMGCAAGKLSAGRADLYQSPEGNCCCWDGRLDNRKELLLQGGLPEASPNSAIALWLYVHKGSSGLRELIGDWSLSLWDAKQQRVVLASDYAGIRPLFYYHDAGKLCWSSSIGDVNSWTGITELDDLYVGSFLLRGSAGARTPYTGIFAVPSGHAVRVERTGIDREAFWSLPAGREIRYQNIGCYEEELLGLFREAVQVRLSRTAPACAELSGGLDSSSVVCMADRVLSEFEGRGHGLNTFSYTHENCADEKYFREVERVTSVSGCHLEIQPYPAVTADAAGGVPAWWLPRFAELARRMAELGSGVFLTGQFGDLIMGNTTDDSDQVAEFLARGNFTKAVGEAYGWARALRVPIYPILWRSIRQSCSSWVPSPSPLDSAGAIQGSREDSLPPALRALVAGYEQERNSQAPWRHAPPGRRRRFRGVYESLQARALQAPEPLQHISYTHPFAHRPLVEFMLTIPSGVVCAPNEPRRLMRRAFTGLLPPLILGRKSKAAYTSIYLGSLVPLATVMLRDPAKIQLAERGYADAKSLLERLRKFVQGLDCNQSQLRQLIVLEFWLRNMTLRAPSSSPRMTTSSAAPLQ